MTASFRQSSVLAACILWSAAAAADASVSVPMTVEGGRPYIDVQFTDADGNPVKAHAWLDTGGGSLVFTQKLADRLGLKPVAGGFKSEGEHLAQLLPVPAMALADTPLKLQADVPAYEVLSNAAGLQGTDADLAIPVRALRAYDVVFDYPAGKFSVDASGGEHGGTEVPVQIGASGMPVVTVQAEGKTYGFLLDTGGTCTMLSEQVMASWIYAHKDWHSLEGAYGRGNMLLGAKFESGLKMLDIPRLDWGPFPIEHLVAVSRPAGVYEQSMSKIAGGDIVGSLGGDLFRYFRIEIDYPQAKLYLSRGKPVMVAPLDMAGLMLEPGEEGGYEVAKIQGEAGGVAVGDHLLKVGELDATHAPFPAILAALSGRPGERRAVTVQRGDKTLTFQVPVQHLLGTRD